MAHKRLYIIGNGFDLHYGIKSSYYDFMSFLEREDEAFFTVIRDVVSGDLWRDFEGSLSEIRPGAFEEDFFGEFSACNEDPDDEYIELDHAYRNHLEHLEETFTLKRLQDLFDKWVRSIDISHALNNGLIEDDPETIYLIFNYTDTVEKVYDVAESRILHIHGKRGDELPIIGHAPVYEESEKRFAPHEFPVQGTLEQMRSRFIEETTKPVDYLIKTNARFFSSLSEIEEVIVIGFSFGEVDQPYIDEITRSIKHNCTWTVYERDTSKNKRYPILGVIKKRAYPPLP